MEKFKEIIEIMEQYKTLNIAQREQIRREAPETMKESFAIMENLCRWRKERVTTREPYTG